MVWYACKSSRVVLAWHSARQASAPGALKARWDTASYSSDCQLCKTAQKGSRPSFSSLEKSAKSINGSFAARAAANGSSNCESELEELKSQLTTLNHIKYNFDIITRDHLPEPTDLDREQSTER